MQATALASRQDSLEKGMNRLLDVTTNLSDKFTDHTLLLDQASNKTNQVLDTLEETAAKAESVNASLVREAVNAGWWPYIICPTVSLIMGSYGLPPSAFRNIGLLALGELIGLAVSFRTHLRDGTAFFPLRPLGNETVASL